MSQSDNLALDVTVCYHMCMQIYTFSSVAEPAFIYYSFD